MRPAAENHVEVCTVPNCKIITRSTGEILFALKINREVGEQFEILTAQQLYDDYAWQWFEPLADNYHELIYLNEGPETHTAYKHFSWQDIVDFSSIDRLSVSYYQNLPGDWKTVKMGGDGYLMVMIEGSPYWTDAVGQVPFAVDTYRSTHDIKYVVSTGMTWGKGTVSGPADKTNGYDNFMVLRGALFASKKYTYKYGSSYGGYSDASEIEITNDTESSMLAKAITESELNRYGVWNEK